ncbi:sushi, von Willebrand factor type A, EGF and pentraxin domain-containing protein 1-like, partial [Scleropages formosus]
PRGPDQKALLVTSCWSAKGEDRQRRASRCFIWLRKAHDVRGALQPSPKPFDAALMPGDGQGEAQHEVGAPLCLGGCRGKHRELKRDRCGNSSCCWFGYKSLCRVNCGKPDADYNSIVYGNDWWVGSVVRYDCRPGFMLIGDSARACQSDGKWTPKPTCLRVCQRGRLEINEKDIDGTCSSTCPAKTYAGKPNHGCIRIDNCMTKQSGWKRWFVRCDFCECDCLVPCDLLPLTSYLHSMDFTASLGFGFSDSHLQSKGLHLKKNWSLF